MIREIDRLDAEPLRGITTARSPFFSADAKWIGFFQGQSGGELKKVSVTGGPPITLCKITGTARGASWGSDDVIVFATADNTTGLLSVPGGGGEPKVLTKPDPARGELDHVFPSVLAGGRAVLFTITAGQADNAQIAVLDLKTGQRKTLIRGGSYAEYVAPSTGSGQAGYLVYAVAGTLRAVRFDPVKLEVLGDPVPIVDQVTMMPTGAAQFRLSKSGGLVYVPGGLNSGGLVESLVWVDRRGHEEMIPSPVRSYAYPRLSPDGTRLAVNTLDQENDIWIWDFSRKTLTRLTFDPATDFSPIWAPDGHRIVFASARGGVPNLFWRAADGTGADERLTTSPNVQWPSAFSPDGKILVVQENGGGTTGNDIRVLRLVEGPAPPGKLQTEPLIQSAFSDYAGEISPDGRWIAYYSNESGSNEVYVRPFPNVQGGRWQISTGGGTRPAWSRKGGELFYLDTNLSMMSVPVQTTSTFTAGNPTKLFEGKWYVGQPGRTYDVSADGQRFLMIKDAAGGNQTAPSANINVVLNWTEELRQRVPLK